MRWLRADRRRLTFGRLARQNVKELARAWRSSTFDRARGSINAQPHPAAPILGSYAAAARVTESSLSAPTGVDEVTCQEFVELITDYVEGALSGQTLSQVEEHLVICDWCATYLEQMESTIASLRELARRADGADGADGADPPEALLAVLRERHRGLR